MIEECAKIPNPHFSFTTASDSSSLYQCPEGGVQELSIRRRKNSHTCTYHLIPLTSSDNFCVLKMSLPISIENLPIHDITPDIKLSKWGQISNSRSVSVKHVCINQTKDCPSQSTPPQQMLAISTGEVKHFEDRLFIIP